MVLYATLIPFEIGEDIQLNFYQDLIKALILLTELIFLYQSLKSKNNFSEDQAYLRVITVALGWSFAESLINNLFYYLFNSMGEEFTWEYIRTAILANVSMIDKMAIVARTKDYPAHDTLYNISAHAQHAGRGLLRFVPIEPSRHHVLQPVHLP